MLWGRIKQGKETGSWVAGEVLPSVDWKGQWKPSLSRDKLGRGTSHGHPGQEASRQTLQGL